MEWNDYISPYEVTSYYEPGFCGQLRWVGVRDGERRDGTRLSMEDEFHSRNLRPMNIVVLGHSFMRHLEKDITRRKGAYHNLGLSYDVANVNWVFKGGMSIDEASFWYADHVLAYNPDIVFIQLGTCDADKYYYSAREVSDGLVHLGYKLIREGVQKVVFGEILHRQPHGIPFDVPEFNYKVDNINEILRREFHEEYSTKINLWRHKAFWCSRKNVYYKDGLHLNRLGNLRMYRSVRAAMLKSIWLLMEYY